MGEARIKPDFSLVDLSVNSDVPVLAPRQFKFFVDLILSKSGIRLQESKMNLVSSRLSRRLRVNSLKTWDEYIDLLKANDPVEMSEFINVMTTNKTEFFREQAHFDFIKQVFLPDAISSGNDHPLFWIGASSFGQEIWSLVMILEKFRETHPSMDYKVLGTDIDTKVLGKAQEAVYEASLVEKDVPPSMIKKFFLKGSGPNEGYYRFSPEYSDRVKFRQHNLCSMTEKIPIHFDVIFLRNVLIYFKPETVENVITKALRHLKPGGYLILGHCESIVEMKWNLELMQHSTYRKLG